jgi:hypothetical protein
MIGPQIMTTNDIAGWFIKIDPQYTYFHGKLFSFVMPRPQLYSEFAAKIRMTREAFPDKHSIFLAIGDFSEMIKVESRFVPCIDDGILKLMYFISDGRLPKCAYLCVISPAAKEGASTNYSQATRSINFVKSLLSLHFSSLCTYTLVADFDFDVNGKIALSTEFFRMPLAGSMFAVVDPELANTIMERLALQLPEYRQRVFRACDFVSDAMNLPRESLRFSLYWIALEILAGKSDAIRAKLAAAYGGQSKKFVDEAIKFKQIAGMRVDLMHHGRFVRFHDWQERLMQLYLWDIVIHDMNLPARGLAQAFVKSDHIEREMLALT